MARTVEDQDIDIIWLDTFGLGQRVDVFGGRGIKIDHTFGVARADGDFVHIHVGGVKQ